MSGPKTSRYILTPEQRRLLALQREMNRRRAVASENIRRNSKKLLRFEGMFSRGKLAAAELIARTGDDGGFLQKTEELEKLTAAAVSMAQKADDKDIAELEKTDESVRKCAYRAEELAKDLSEAAVINERTLRGLLGMAIDKGFHASSAGIEAAAGTPEGDAGGRAREQLLQMRANSALSAEMAEEIDSVLSGMDEIRDAAFLKNYTALMVQPLIKRCRRFLAEYEACHGEFEKLYSEYAALCGLYGYAAQEYPCAGISVKALKTEIQRIKEEAAEDDEQGYISECLDEVMEEMGYIVLGRRDVTKKNGTRFRNKLYQYGEGTAVNVTYSSDGKVAMELGGMDDADRLPDEREASFLCDSMECFCDDFKEIEKRLLAKGVVLAERISMLPPEAEYAQIINMSDYELKSEAKKLEEKKLKVEKLKAERQRRPAVTLKSRSDTNEEV